MAATTLSTCAECTKNFWQTADDSERAKFCSSVKVYCTEYKMHAHVCRPIVYLLVECNNFMNLFHIEWGEIKTIRNSGVNWKWFDEFLFAQKIENVENSFNTAFNSLMISSFLLQRTQPQFGGSRFFASFSFHTMYEAIVGMLKDSAASAFLCGCSWSKSIELVNLVWVFSVGYKGRAHTLITT